MNVDDCVGDPCEHEGTCVDLVAGFSCRCLPGFAGARCEESAPPQPASGDNVTDTRVAMLHDDDDDGDPLFDYCEIWFIASFPIIFVLLVIIVVLAVCLYRQRRRADVCMEEARGSSIAAAAASDKKDGGGADSDESSSSSSVVVGAPIRVVKRAVSNDYVATKYPPIVCTNTTATTVNNGAYDLEKKIDYSDDDDDDDDGGNETPADHIYQEIRTGASTIKVPPRIPPRKDEVMAAEDIVVDVENDAKNTKC